MNEEYSDMFSELSGHSGSKEYESMPHVLLSFVGRTYEKWMDQQYTDRSSEIDIRKSIFVKRSSVIDIRKSIFEKRYSKSDIRKAIFENRYSKIDIRKSIFENRYSRIYLQKSRSRP